jgi:hypothetical protein
MTIKAIHAKIVCWLNTNMYSDVASKPNCSKRRGCAVASLRRPHHGAAINTTSDATVESRPISAPLRPRATKNRLMNGKRKPPPPISRK